MTFAPPTRPRRAPAVPPSDLALLARVTDALARGEEPAAVLERILAHLADLAGGTRVAIWVTPEQLQAVLPGAPAGAEEVALSRRAALVTGGDLAEEIRDRRAFYTSSTSLPGDRLYVPLPDGGVAICQPAATPARGGDDMRLLQVLANLAQVTLGVATQAATAGQRAAALERTRQRLLEQTVVLRQVAVVDELTGLHNRRFFDLRLASELERLQRYHHPLSLVLFDLDHFKRVNDTYGHPGGDAVLVAVAAAVKAQLRRTDIVCRHGGEEFAVLLTDTDREGSLITAERLRASVEALTVDLGAAHVSVTISLGVATAAPGWTGTPADLVRTSDDALYRAKQAGRNRVGV